MLATSKPFKCLHLAVLLAWVMGVIANHSAASSPAPSPDTHSSHTVDIELAAKRTALREYVVFKEDTSNQSVQSILQAFTNGEFDTPDSPSLQFGYRKSTIWLAFKLANTSEQRQNVFLEARYAPLDNVNFYVFENGKLATEANFGDKLPYDSRVIKARNYILPLEVPAKTTYTVLVSAKSTSSLSIPLYLSDNNSLYEFEHDSQVALGLFYGISFGLFFYNIFLFFSTRNIIYFQYVTYIAGYTLFMASLDGFLYRLWPDNPDWESRSIYFFAWFGFVFLAAFIRRLLRTKQESPISDWVLLFLMYAYLVGCIAILLVDDVYIIGRINSPSILLTVLCLLVIMLVRVIQGSKEASITLVGMTCFFIGMVAVAGGTLNLHSYYEIAPWVMKTGSSIEMILFSIALAYKLNSLELKNKLSQARALKYLESYEQLYKNSIEGQFQVNEEGQFIKSNPAWRKIIGYENDENLLHSEIGIDEILQEPSQFKVLKEICSKGDKVENYLIKVKNRSNTEPVFVNLSLRKELVNNQPVWVGTANDITEKHKQDEFVKHLQEEKTQSLKQLVMGVSHEMNTPLGNVNIAQSFLNEFLESLDADKESKETLKEGIGAIGYSVSKLKELGSLIKSTVVTDRTFHLDQIDLEQWFESWKQHIVEQYDHINIEIDNQSEIQQWEIYSEALDNFLNRLVDNSVVHNYEQYEGKSLKVSITTQLESKDGNEELLINYKDNGKGIETDDPSEIFQPFYTTRRQNAKEKGLGMYYVYNLITETLSGNIEWPKQDGGFSVNIRIPKQNISSFEKV